MPDIRLSKAAESDIRELERYSADAFGSAKTAEYLQGLRDTFVQLRDYPGLGVSRDDLRTDTRSLRYASHRIYYRPVPDGILVQRVLHYARQVRREMIEDR